MRDIEAKRVYDREYSRNYRSANAEYRKRELLRRRQSRRLQRIESDRSRIAELETFLHEFGRHCGWCVMRDLEHKRAYDRERMARLHAKGDTWWQQRPGLRHEYDTDPAHRFRANLLRDIRNARRGLAQVGRALQRSHNGVSLTCDSLSA